MDTQELEMNGRFQRAVGVWVSSWIENEQNELMEYILATPQFPDYDKVFESISCEEIDYESAIADWLNDLQPDTGREYELLITETDIPREAQWIVSIVDGDGEPVENFYTGQDDDRVSALAEFCDWNDVPLEGFTFNLEVFEWYAINSHIAEKLKKNEIGVVVSDVVGMTIWGRTCSDQSIEMDYSIMELFKAEKPEIVAAIESGQIN
jgi:translation initiation factor IF-1